MEIIERDTLQHSMNKNILKEFNQSKAQLKIGVFLPQPYQGDMLRSAKSIAKMLYLGSRANGEPVDVVFSCFADCYTHAEDFSDLMQLGISIRETEWRTISRDNIEISMLYLNKEIDFKYSTYLLPTDNICNFNDCDLWLIISDRTVKPLAPVKRYGMVVYDYNQRYIPGLVSSHSEINYFASARDANFILTNTPHTREDAIQYAGVNQNDVHVMPWWFDPIEMSIMPTLSMKECDYIVWNTSANSYHNHLLALDALDIYYNELNGKLVIKITGFDTNHFDIKNPYKGNSSYIKKVRNKIESKESLKKSLFISGELGTRDFISILSHAQFLWHPNLMDGGTLTVTDAAYYGIPTLCGDYPQMHYINQQFKLNMSFCHATDARNMAIKLKNMEEQTKNDRHSITQRNYLDQFSYKAMASDFWRLFRSNL